MAEPPRKRARTACLACNARRVKCNVTESQPCNNCLASEVACEIRESRRGRHPRPRAARNSIASTTSDEVTATHVLASLSHHSDRPTSPTDKIIPIHQQSLQPPPLPAPPPPPPPAPARSIIDEDPRGDDEDSVFLGESTSIRYVHHPDSCSAADAESHHSNSPTDNHDLSSSTASHQHHHTSPGNTHGPKLLYAVPPITASSNRHGATPADNPMAEWQQARKAARLRSLEAEGAFALPPAPIVTSLLQAYFRWFHPCFAIVDEPDIWALHSTNSLSPLLLQSLLFIGAIHCDEVDFEACGLGGRHKARWTFYSRAKDLYDADVEPRALTVMQSLFLLSFWRAGVGFLEKDARHWLSAAISLAQTRAMHRRGSGAVGPSQAPSGSAVAAASSSTTTPGGAIQPLSGGIPSEQDEINAQRRKRISLRKRIWWSVYTRERQCAAALGLPNRIRDEDCDVESLVPADFEGAYGKNNSCQNDGYQHQQHHGYVSYMIGMAELSQILGRVVHSGYLPNRTGLGAADRLRLRNDLVQWKRRLPPEMQIDRDDDFGDQQRRQEDGLLLPSMLHLAYNNLLILLYRSGYIGEGGGGPTEPAGAQQHQNDVDGQVALQAAARNARIIEDLFPQGNLRHAQIHVITNLFNTLCIHTVSLRRLAAPSEGTSGGGGECTTSSNNINNNPNHPNTNNTNNATARGIAEHRAKVCLLGLQELGKTWEVRSWILQLFFHYLDRSTAALLRQGVDHVAVDSAAGDSTKTGDGAGGAPAAAAAAGAPGSAGGGGGGGGTSGTTTPTWRSRLQQSGAGSLGASLGGLGVWGGVWGAGAADASQRQHHQPGDPNPQDPTISQAGGLEDTPMLGMATAPGTAAASPEDLLAAAAGETPWSWSTEEANAFLFSQIETDFAFGEGGGGVLDFGGTNTYSSMLFS